MAKLQTNGSMSLSDIIFNRTEATPSTNGNYSFGSEANTFASGATVGDRDNRDNPGDAGDRDELKAQPHSITEWYGSNHPNSNFSSPVAKLADGTDVTSNGYVDGESGRIYWTVDDDDGIGTSFTAGLKLQNGSVAVSATDTLSGTGTKYIAITAPSIDAGNDKYYSFVTNATSPFIQAQGADINHYDDIASATVDAVSTSTVANNSVQTTIEHGLSLGDNSSLNFLEWDFAKTSGDGSNPNPTDIDESSDTTPSVTYTGVGVFTAVCKAVGQPTEARNSRTSATVTHRIEYTDFIECANPSTAHYNTEIDNNVSHRGFIDDGSETITYGLVSSSATTTFANGAWETSPASPRTLDSDSRTQARSFGIGITPADVQWTQYLQIRAVTDTGVADNSNTFTYYPEIRNNRNTISHTSKTIYSTTRNPSYTIGDHPTSHTFTTPGTQTDNVTNIKYYEETPSSLLSISANAEPSDLNVTQATVAASTTVGSNNVIMAITGSGASTQTSQTSCAVAVHFAKHLYSLSAVTVGGVYDTTADDLTFNYNWQGFSLGSVRYELFADTNGDGKPDTQRGNDQDSNWTGTAGSTTTAQNSGTITISNGVSGMGYNNAGTYYMKINVYDLAGQSTSGGAFATSSFTNTFVVYKSTERTDDLYGLEIDSQFQGWETPLLAAEKNGSEVNYDDVVGGGELWSLNNNVNSVYRTNEDLSNIYDFTQGDGNFYHYDGVVLGLGNTGIITSSLDATPSAPEDISVASSSTSDTTHDVTVTGETTLARRIHLYYGSSNGATTYLVGADAGSQVGSLAQTFSNVDVSVMNGNDVYYSARYIHNAESGSKFSYNKGHPTPGTSVSTSESAYDETAADGQVRTSASKTFTISLASGNTTITLTKVSGTTQFNVKFAAVTSGTPSSFVNQGNTITLSASSNVIIRTQFEGRAVLVGNDGDYRITVTNNSVSATLDVNMVTIPD